jgi:hypothetical protein
MRRSTCVVLLLLTFGCHGFGPDEETTAVLAGKVYRGPITPVCLPEVPCDAPFSASFEVRRGSRRVATFSSSADGSFRVALPAGELRVVPFANAPLMDPTSQSRSVTLPPGGLTGVELFFDTGIR